MERRDAKSGRQRKRTEIRNGAGDTGNAAKRQLDIGENPQEFGGILGESQNEVKKKTTLRTFGHFDDVADVFHAYRIIWR